MRYPSREIVEHLKKEYPAGTRVELVRMDDAQAPPIGTRGTVYAVDDTGSLCVNWDNGSGLNVIYGEDVVRKIAVTTVCYGKKEEWTSRRAAEEHFFMAMAGTEGCEQERYTKIYTELMMGFAVCTDE